MVGFCRAVTFSLAYNDFNYDWNRYRIYRGYDRSINFWIPCLIIYLLSLLVWFEHKLENSISHKYKDTNQELKRTVNDLNNFKLAYQKIERDFSGSVSNSENNLQHMQSAYDKSSLENDLKKAVGMGRHDVLNRIKTLRSDTQYKNYSNRERVQGFIEALKLCESDDKEILRDNYDLILGPWIEKIHKELKGLDQTLDITLDYYDVNTVVAMAEEAVPINIVAGRTDVIFTRNVPPCFKLEERCQVIISKVKSIVFNLIQNSATATEAYFDTLEGEKEDNFQRKISLIITDIQKDNKKFLCIEVNDNGGGFPDNVVDKVYKEPIPTTKDNKREHGEGTSYVGFFVSLMTGCKIEAKNIVNEDGEKGASTKLYIPYYE